MLSAWEEERAELIHQGMRQDCYGRDLTDAGWAAFDRLMPEALRGHDDDWLTTAMTEAAYWNTHYLRRGKRVELKPGWAAKRLCGTEFNCAYVRGLARTLLRRGETHCLVYRATDTAEGRRECATWEGRAFPLEQILMGHRGRYFPAPGDVSAISVPIGPFCHHTIRALSVRE